MQQDPFPLHQEHAAWQSEHRQWQRDLEAWRDQGATLTERLTDLLGRAMEHHERELLDHASSIDAHELAIAEERLGGEPDDSRRSDHERHEPRHVITRARHQQLATTLRLLHELVSTLEAVDVGGEHSRGEAARGP